MFALSIAAPDRAAKPLAIIVYLSCAVLLVWFGVALMAPAPEVAPTMQNQPSAKFRMNQAAEARLFGVETAGGLTPPSIVLMGIFAGEEGNGAAVMSVEGKPGVSYRVGDTVANGWVLDSVEQRQAVIARSGQRHKVQMPRLDVDPSLIKRVQ